MMTKKEAIALYRSEVLPQVRAQYEQDRRRDYPARCEAWNNFVDALASDRQITRWQAETWTHPPENIAPWERSQKTLARAYAKHLDWKEPKR